VIAFVAVFVLGLRILSPFLTPLSLSLLLTYMLVPVVNRVQHKTGWPRTLVAIFVYLLFIIVLALIPALFVPVIVNQVEALVPTLIVGINQLEVMIAEQGNLSILSQQLNPDELFRELSSSLINLSTSLAGSSLTIVFGFAASFLSTIIWLFLILFISFYIVRDSPNIYHYFWGLVPHEARHEVYYLVRRIDQTWNAFLRGQLILSGAMFVITTITLSILGVRQALFLGFLAGLLNFIPNIGPVLCSIPAIALALIQGSSQFDISNSIFAIIVAITYVIIQQLEGNILVPRIIGGSVNLHPAMIILGAIIGFSLIGILGIFLAAPTLASLRVILGYAYRKLVDPEFQPPQIELPPDILATTDPRQRSMIPIASPNDPPTIPKWQQWLKRTAYALTATPSVTSEDSQDA
jgi:predicted PurR-regulated permease PerM